MRVQASVSDVVNGANSRGMLILALGHVLSGRRGWLVRRRCLSFRAKEDLKVVRMTLKVLIMNFRLLPLPYFAFRFADESVDVRL
jgi:hypothetical protein